MRKGRLTVEWRSTLTLTPKMEKSSMVIIYGQSHKHFTLINYNSRVVITSKLIKLTTLELYFISVKCL